ncbi:hypothetical protein AAFF_G00238800 [Aldrovandia affinis]|uniref:Uncharacterized protein n=1 Tax=Aldrovandia affinis TaxID=143900 RepID=A0AAD7R088_9TELE|nr:hypothetical protein AAFF_G00238800 [Aldrovandia affinis]
MGAQSRDSMPFAGVMPTLPWSICVRGRSGVCLWATGLGCTQYHVYANSLPLWVIHHASCAFGSREDASRSRHPGLVEVDGAWLMACNMFGWSWVHTF